MVEFYGIQGDQSRVRASVSNNSEVITIKLERDKITSKSGMLEIVGELFNAQINDDGFFLCTSDFLQYSSFLTYFTDREDFVISKYRSLAGAFGISNKHGCFLGVVTGMQYDCKWKIAKIGSVYSFSILYDLDAIDLYEDIELKLYKMPNSSTYVDLAKKYRKYMLTEGKCVPICQKIKENKTLAYLKDSVEIRIRMAWKPAPSPVMEQTLENEPDMFVACTFDDVYDFITALKNHGVEKAQLCLVGWNISGHDGRWPDAFPVDPRLGGEDKLKRLIEYAKNSGYKIVCHTNSTDCYSISEKFQNGAITLKDRSGNPVSDKCVWSGGRMYHLCPKVAWEIAQETLPKIAELGFEGSHYVDVMSIIRLRTCFDKDHPCNAKQTQMYFEKIADLSKQLFGGFSSEGSFDHSAGHLDFGLYTKFNRKQITGMDEGVNFFEIAFHGIVMSNAGSNTVNYTIKDASQRLKTAEFCYRPAFYIFSKFKADGRDWMGKDDLKIGTKEDTDHAAQAIKKGYDDYKAFSYLQNEFIEDHREISDNLFVTVFSDGSQIISNYNETPYKFCDNTVGAMDYIIVK